MTKDILQTDIDLAKRLRDEQRPDEEIVQALVHRGVDPTKAANVADALRNGRKTSVQLAIPAEFTLGVPARPRRPGRRSGRRSSSRSSRTAPRSEQSSPAATPGLKMSPAIKWGGVGLALVVLAVVAFVIYQRLNTPASSTEPQPPKAASATVDRPR
ncbi:MAG: hypothetical protein NT154_11190 [Verrucomicrobia bacterium]|nr:hypothetical protein [Verrucomicrobiota bacterium]